MHRPAPINENRGAKIEFSITTMASTKASARARLSFLRYRGSGLGAACKTEIAMVIRT